jgi:hypothetical protein
MVDMDEIEAMVNMKDIEEIKILSGQKGHGVHMETMENITT